MDIETLMRRWGRSAPLDDTRHLDYPAMTTFARLARTSGSWAVGQAPLSDEQHALVDAAVSQLKLRSRERWLVLVGSYVMGWGDAKIGRELERSRTAVREIRVAALAWVEAKVCDGLDP